MLLYAVYNLAKRFILRLKCLKYFIATITNLRGSVIVVGLIVHEVHTLSSPRGTLSSPRGTLSSPRGTLSDLFTRKINQSII